MKTQLFLIALIISAFFSENLYAHCDTIDGPVVADAKRALSRNNVNYVLKWVMPEYEDEVTEAFSLVMRVRLLSEDSRNLADRYFFETLVRLHRTGEGMSYTGIKPPGTPVDEKVVAADRSIASGDISSLEELVPDEKRDELKERFEKVMALKDFDVNDVKAGRKYIEAYVQFFHFAEGEDDVTHASEGNSEH